MRGLKTTNQQNGVSKMHVLATKKPTAKSADIHKLFVIAETKINQEGMQQFLEHFKVPGWSTDTAEDASVLTEVAGRLCYKSFNTELNPNVTRIRQGNRPYVGNLIKQKHGSVLEHSTTTLALCGVSRILTHELVRHRVGIAYSQESQRFVRLDTFNVYVPDLTDALDELSRIALPDSDDTVREEWVQARQESFFDIASEVESSTKHHLNRFIKESGLDNDNVTFYIKKTLTSALRRFIPGGVTTDIVVTANHRTWRHLIEARTSGGAETEIWTVFFDIAQLLYGKYPAIYQDMYSKPDDYSGRYGFAFEHSKI